MGPLVYLARPERFELPTTWFEARYSIQLSYGRLDRKRTIQNFSAERPTNFKPSMVTEPLSVPLDKPQVVPCRFRWPLNHWYVTRVFHDYYFCLWQEWSHYVD